jgi:hypothetical protein
MEVVEAKEDWLRLSAEEDWLWLSAEKVAVVERERAVDTAIAAAGCVSEMAGGGSTLLRGHVAALLRCSDRVT